MHQATVCILKNGQSFCLGLKKRGFGAGNWNGFGGKVKAGESLAEAARREVKEEIGVVLGKIVKMAEVTFTFPQIDPQKGWDQVVHVYLCRDWQGEPAESEEMKPQWFAEGEIPYEQMWDDDRYWLPLVLVGQKIRARFSFDKDNKVASKVLEVVELFK